MPFAINRSIALERGKFFVDQKLKKKKTWTIVGSFFEHFWEPFWVPFWDQIGQRGGKMSPREPSGASKSQKTACPKTFKN